MGNQNTTQMGAEAKICDSITSYENQIKKIQDHLDNVSSSLESAEPESKLYAELKGKQWSLNQVLLLKKRMLKKWQKAAKDSGVEI